MTSIDPTTTSFSDLEPLTTVLDGVSVVLLGEATRGDGTTFLAKTRLVRFLHERMDFDVLALEANVFEASRAAERIRDGDQPAEALDNSLFPLYLDSEQFQPLLDLVAETAKSERPLEIAGFDHQLFAGAESDLPIALRQQVLRLGGGDRLVAGVDRLEPVLGDLSRDAYVTGQSPVPSPADRREIRRTFESLQALFETAAGAADEAAKTWHQLVMNLDSLADASWRLGRWDPRTPLDPEVQNIRHEQMADNVLWLLRERFPGRKLIVWSTTITLTRDLDQLVTGDAATRERFEKLVPMGDHLARELGDEAYFVAFTAFQGHKNIRFGPPHALLVPTSGSFEDLMGKTGLEAAFVDLRTPPEGGGWLGRRLIARPISFKELLGVWPKHVDGLFFLRTLEASDRLVSE